MMIRKYVVREMSEAVVQIRRELGKDAVILNTRKVWSKRFGGLLRSRRIEVVAATGDDVPVRVPFSKKEDRDTTHISPESQRPESFQPVKASEEAASTEATKVSSDIEQIRPRFESAGRPRSVDQWIARIHSHLISQQVKDEYVNAFMSRAAELQKENGQVEALAPLSFETVRQSLMDAVYETLGVLWNSKPLADSSRIVAFIGPTGVGKTTTIAKIAALHVLGGVRKVGLITTDTFRIAAVDQLRTYANILSVPLRVVYHPHELQGAIDSLNDCDLILVDTAGRNFMKPKPIEETLDLLVATHFDEVHLVLSLTSKPEDLDSIVSAFHDVPVTQVLLTKLDETRTYGSFLNILLEYGRPVSYVTMGQNVPDDISVASVERLMKLTAGGAMS